MIYENIFGYTVIIDATVGIYLSLAALIGVHCALALGDYNYNIGLLKRLGLIQKSIIK